MKVVTVNTDAGHYSKTKKGSYAYYIRGDNLLLKGSGLFKEDVKGSTHAEFYAVMNAIFILKTMRVDFDLLIFNRDNKNVVQC